MVTRPRSKPVPGPGAHPVASTADGEPVPPGRIQACGCADGVWRWDIDGDDYPVDECVSCGAVWRTEYACGHCGGRGYL